MRYSIRGTSISTVGDKLLSTELIDHIDDTIRIYEYEDGNVGYEIWVNTVEEKNLMFNDLKAFVDENGGIVSWHECSHWDEIKTPCVIAEEYRGE